MSKLGIQKKCILFANLTQFQGEQEIEHVTFQIDEVMVRDKYVNWVQSLWFAPTGFKKVRHHIEIVVSFFYSKQQYLLLEKYSSLFIFSMLKPNQIIR